MSARHDISLQFWPDGSVSPTRYWRCRGSLCRLEPTFTRFPKCVCRNILWYGSTYAQILSHPHAKGGRWQICYVLPGRFVMFSKFVMFSNRLCNWCLQLASHICYLFGQFHQPRPYFYLIQSNWRATRLEEQHKCGTIHCKKLEHFMEFIIIVIVFGLFLV